MNLNYIEVHSFDWSFDWTLTYKTRAEIKLCCSDCEEGLRGPNLTQRTSPLGEIHSKDGLGGTLSLFSACTINERSAASRTSATDTPLHREEFDMVHGRRRGMGVTPNLCSFILFHWIMFDDKEMFVKL